MEKETTRNCLICTSTTLIGHLGIDACRACAAFFKRCQATGKRFPCRQGNGKCTFRKHQKFMCRSCRYDKCIQFGMAFDQLLPDLANPVIESTEQPRLNRSSVIRKADEPKKLGSILERVGKYYNAAHAELFVSNVSAYYELYGSLIEHAVALFKNIDPVFDRIQLSTKTSLFKSFLAKFVMVESFYLSAKYLRNEANYLFCSLLTCFDCQNLDLWLTSEISAEKQRDFFEVSLSISCSLKGYAVDYVTLLHPTLKIGAISKKEFHSLIALAFCDVDTTDLADNLSKELDALRKRTFRELHVYYACEMKQREYSQRLGNLMTIAHMAHEAGRIVYEEFRTYAAMFDLYTHDSLLREIFFS